MVGRVRQLVRNRKQGQQQATDRPSGRQRYTNGTNECNGLYLFYYQCAWWHCLRAGAASRPARAPAAAAALDWWQQPTTASGIVSSHASPCSAADGQRQVCVEVGGVVALLPGQPLAVGRLENKLHATARRCGAGGRAGGSELNGVPGGAERGTMADKGVWERQTLHRQRHEGQPAYTVPPPSRSQRRDPAGPQQAPAKNKKPAGAPHRSPCWMQSLSGRRSASANRAGSTNTGEPSSAAME